MAEATGMEIAFLHTGEIVSLEDVAKGEWIIPRGDPAACARTLDQVRRIEALFRDLKQDLRNEVLIESERQGSKTLYFEDDLKVEVSGGTVIDWDYEVLERLRDAGLPEDRYDALVRAKVEYSVDMREAKRIAGANPEYARIIELARTERDAAHRVSVVRS